MRELQRLPVPVIIAVALFGTLRFAGDAALPAKMLVPAEVPPASVARVACIGGDPPPQSERVPDRAPARAEDPLASASALRIELLDVATGGSVAGSIELWRIGLAEDEQWTAGDERIGLREAPLGLLKIEGLTPGRYRAACGMQRLGALDPPAFVVAGDETRVELRLALPLERDAFLLLFTETGVLLGEAERYGAPTRSETTGGYAPDWPAPRRTKREDLDTTGGIGGGGSFQGVACRAWTRTRADAHGFALGKSVEDSQRTARSVRARFRGIGRTEATCTVKGSDLGEARYAAASIDPRTVLVHVLLPDGRDARGFARDVLVQCDARHVGAADLDAAWRAVEIAVFVEHAGYDPLAFRYRPAAGEPEDRVLTPVRAPR